MSQSVRLFVALNLSSTAQQAVQDTLEQIRGHFPSRSVRWIPPDKIHLTLKFLGDVPVSQIEAIQTALAQAVQAFATVEMDIRKLGCFPNVRRPRIIWLGVDDRSGHLPALRDSVEAAIAPLGYPTEKRPFTPHLTVGRLRRGLPSQELARIGQTLDELQVGDVGAWRAGAVNLMKSELHPDGARYTSLLEATLQAGDAPRPS